MTDQMAQRKTVGDVDTKAEVVTPAKKVGLVFLPGPFRFSVILLRSPH